MLVCICSVTWGDMGTLSLGELLDVRVSVGRPNLLLKKEKGVSAGSCVTENIEQVLLKKLYFYKNNGCRVSSF